MYAFDLEINNSVMGVITRSAKDHISLLQSALQNMLYKKSACENYFQIKNMFKYLDSQKSRNDVVKLFAETVKENLQIACAIIDDKNCNLSTYVSIWKNHANFINKLTGFVGNSLPKINNLLSRTYATNFLEYVMLRIVSPEKKLFYHHVIESITKIIDTSDVSEQKYFMENLFDFLISLDTISIHHNQQIDIHRFMYNIIVSPQIMEYLCMYMHNTILEIRNDAAILDNSKYYMMQPYVIKNNNIALANKILDLLCISNADTAQKNKFISIYTNYLQLRITSPKYSNLDLELSFAEKIHGDKNNRMYLAIFDIKNSIVDQYYDEINNVKMNAFYLKKDNWCLNDVQFPINYPIKMKHFLDHMSMSKHDCTINWQPTLGLCKFVTLIGTKNVTITCNFLQAIALSYFDEHTDKIFSVHKFVEYTQINPSLSLKIFESLIESFVIIYKDDSSEDYVPNDKYNGLSKIDIRPMFVKVFENEKN